MKVQLFPYEDSGIEIWDESGHIDDAHWRAPRTLEERTEALEDLVTRLYRKLAALTDPICQDPNDSERDGTITKDAH